MELRKTRQRLHTLELLAYLGESHGFELATRATLKVGTIYGILMAFEQQGAVTSRWEDQPPAGRPRRRLYTLTDSGRVLLEQYREHFGPEASLTFMQRWSRDLHQAIDLTLGGMFRLERDKQRAALQQLVREIGGT